MKRFLRLFRRGNEPYTDDDAQQAIDRANSTLDWLDAHAVSRRREAATTRLAESQLRGAIRANRVEAAYLHRRLNEKGKPS